MSGSGLVLYATLEFHSRAQPSALYTFEHVELFEFGTMVVDASRRYIVLLLFCDGA